MSGTYSFAFDGQGALRGVQSYLRAIGDLWRLDGNRRTARIARFLLRTGKNPVALFRWLDLIHHRPELKFWSTHSPRLFIKPSRHYISRAYRFRERATRIESHYVLLDSLVSRVTIEALATSQLIPLAEFYGKSGDLYQIVIRKTDKFDREGELGLVLLNATQHRAIYYLIFSLNTVHGERNMEIGCLQGGKGPDSAELIKAATKDALGNRPKMLLTEALYVLANAWGIRNIYGIANEFRIFNSSRTYADYDAFWSEIGGHAEKTGMYRLPQQIRHRDAAETESKHRSAHRKKMAILEATKLDVASSLWGL